MPDMQRQGGQTSHVARGEPSEQKILAPKPTISFPKGGGAIRGIGERFVASPVGMAPRSLEHFSNLDSPRQRPPSMPLTLHANLAPGQTWGGTHAPAANCHNFRPSIKGWPFHNSSTCIVDRCDGFLLP